MDGGTNMDGCGGMGAHTVMIALIIASEWVVHLGLLCVRQQCNGSDSSMRMK